MDVHRATDAALTQLDQLAAEYPQLLFIATSNFAGAIDKAVFSCRADLVVTIDLPTPEACKAILLDTLDRLIQVYPKLAALRAAPQIAKAATLAVGLDARRVRKAVLSALAYNKDIASHPEVLLLKPCWRRCKRRKRNASVWRKVDEHCHRPACGLDTNPHGKSDRGPRLSNS